MKGSFWQRGALAFRESLRNDKASQLYSVIVLDGDLENNIRAVKLAAQAEEFVGQFFINKPDFEFENFTIEELCEIIGKEIGIKVDPDIFLKTNSAKQMFSILHSKYSESRVIDKGKRWGVILGEYAKENPKTDPPGLAGDRPINQVVRFCHFAKLMNFANDANDKQVDILSGRMVDKVEKEK